MCSKLLIALPFAIIGVGTLAAVGLLPDGQPPAQSVPSHQANPQPDSKPDSQPVTAPASPEAAKPKVPAAKPTGPGPLIASTGVLDRAKKVGDSAPEFSLPDAQGGTFDLKQALAKGPVVLLWFRGEWCPFCNRQLSGMQAKLAEFDAMNATVVAISPQDMDHSAATMAKDNVKFHMLSDKGSKVGEAYGVRYDIPEAMKAQLKKYNLDLAKYNGGEGDALPLSATYVIDQKGTIRYAFLDPDYTKRASPEELLNAIREMNK